MANELSVNSLLTAFAVPEKSDWIEVARDETGLDDPLRQLSLHVAKNLSFLPFYDHGDLSVTRHYERYTLPPVDDENLNARYWENVPAVAVANPVAANKQALMHLAKGAHGIFFDGIEKTKVVLRDIDRSVCSVWFTAGPGTDNDAADLLHSDTRHNTYLLWEHTPSEPERFLVKAGRSRGLGIAVSRKTDVIEEIVTALVRAVDVLDKLTDQGFTPGRIGSQVWFSFAIENDFFVSIAKFKAMRRLWYQVMRAYDVQDFDYASHFLHARCESPHNDRYQPQGALVANAFAAVAAVCGGCNALTIFSGNSDKDLAAAVARNVSPILANEAQLDKSSDPFSGAYFLETLVHRISEAAWTTFTKRSS